MTHVEQLHGMTKLELYEQYTMLLHFDSPTQSTVLQLCNAALLLLSPVQLNQKQDVACTS